MDRIDFHRNWSTGLLIVSVKLFEGMCMCVFLILQVCLLSLFYLLFIFLQKEETDVTSTYTQNPKSMLRYEYRSVFFTARKPLSWQDSVYYNDFIFEQFNAQLHLLCLLLQEEHYCQHLILHSLQWRWLELSLSVSTQYSGFTI